MVFLSSWHLPLIMLAARYGIPEADWLDLSIGINPGSGLVVDEAFVDAVPQHSLARALAEVAG